MVLTSDLESENLLLRPDTQTDREETEIETEIEIETQTETETEAVGRRTAGVAATAAADVAGGTEIDRRLPTRQRGNGSVESKTESPILM
jgi:hypothetical protein